MFELATIYPGRGVDFALCGAQKGRNEREGRYVHVKGKGPRALHGVVSGVALMICGLGGRTAGPIAELNILLRGIEGCVKDSEGSGSVK